MDRVIKQIKPRIYTYIIDDYTRRLSEKGNQIFTDFASKHALLANCSKHVQYASELYLRSKAGSNHPNDDCELAFDNGSAGTYSPTVCLLENLTKLFTFNFPDLNIVTYDYRDPWLKPSVEELKRERKTYKLETETIERLMIHHLPTLIESI